MKHFGILAYPASHSLSPALHNAVFQKMGEEHIYTRHEVKPEHLSSFMNTWKADTEKCGLSVSVPHKETIIQHLDSIDEAARYIGAINTVYKKNGKTYGTNTDYLGFKKSLEEQYDPINKRCIVLGAGGASRAIVYALLASNTKAIYICNRTEQTAIDLVAEFSKISDAVFHLPNQTLAPVSLETDCIINTTSVGMNGQLEEYSPFPKDLFYSFHSAFDIVYTPKETVFLADCTKAGGNAMSGEDMLLYQAIEQSKIFCGTDALPSSVIETEMRMSMKKARRTADQWTPPSLSSEEKKNILRTIVERKTEELFLCREYTSQSMQKKNVQKTFKFYEALSVPKNTPHLIAEIKPASPSKGQIFTDNDTIESIAGLYTENGASCMSVLTDYPFFGALPENITKARSTSSLPIIRKDFIVHASQITQAADLGASAVLLMRSVLSAQKIQEFIDHAVSLSLDCLVEVHDEQELRDVLENTNSTIIGVNTRDLKTLTINQENFAVLLDIAKQYPNFEEKIWIAESGISSKEDIEQYAQGAHAVLVGTGILQSEDRVEKVRELSL